MAVAIKTKSILDFFQSLMMVLYIYKSKHSAYYMVSN